MVSVRRRQAGLQVPRRRPRRRIARGRPRPTPPTAANPVWAYDFVYDRCANDEQLKCLTVVDEWTRECLAIEVSGSIRSRHVIDVLARLVCTHGAPRYLRSDNGPEFVSRAILQWLSSSGIDTALIDPGKPWQNATNESFNDKFRDECLSLEWFRSRAEAKVLIETWRRHYNEVRPHSSLGYLTPHGVHQQRSRSPIISGPKKSGRPPQVSNGKRYGTPFSEATRRRKTVTNQCVAFSGKSPTPDADLLQIAIQSLRGADPTVRERARAARKEAARRGLKYRVERRGKQSVAGDG